MKACLSNFFLVYFWDMIVAGFVFVGWLAFQALTSSDMTFCHALGHAFHYLVTVYSVVSIICLSFPSYICFSYRVRVT